MALEKEEQCFGLGKSDSRSESNQKHEEWLEEDTGDLLVIG